MGHSCRNDYGEVGGRPSRLYGERKTEIAKKHLATFEPYLNQKYVLIVAWIASREQVLKEFPDAHAMWGERRPCLFVEFSTERAFILSVRPVSMVMTSHRFAYLLLATCK